MRWKLLGKNLWVSVIVLFFIFLGNAFCTKGFAEEASRDGAALFRQNCGRCHAERYPTERMDGQWKTIMLQMQTRALIPLAHARAILKYLTNSN